MQDKETEGAATATVHPVWCSPEHCTAPAEQPTRETFLSSNERGEHRSAPVESTWGADGAYLAQAVAPWETVVHLRTVPEGTLCGGISFTLELGSPLLRALTQHAAEQEARYPFLAADVARKAQRNADAAVVDARHYFEGKAA